MQEDIVIYMLSDVQCVADIILRIKQNKKIEINNEEICNLITTVQKDSMVVEVKN